MSVNNISLNRSSKKGAAPSTDDLRKFYFSGATNYSAFKTKADASGSRLDLSSPAAADTSKLDTTGPATYPAEALSTTPIVAPAAGSAVRAVKEASTAARASSTAAGGASADGVSPDYIRFLRQQQDLVKSHNSIIESLKAILSVVGSHRGDHKVAVGGASELLGEAEASTNWHWKSKFNLDALVQDAELKVPLGELCAADAIPRIADLQHQHQQLVKLRQDHPDHPAFQLLLENGARRFERLIKEFGESQIDAADVTRLSDTLMVQLDHIMSVPPLAHVLRDIDDSIEVTAAKTKSCQGKRDQALEDGAMDVAERESYRLADLSEELVAAQIERIRILSSVSREHSVSSDVRAQYHTKAADDVSLLTANNMDLRTRSETDLANLYKLRRLADDTEQQQSERWAGDRAASDQRLSTIEARQGEAWEQIEMLLKQIAHLEDERHQECKRRIENKVKDESRRNEYQVFRRVADEHAATLDRTIKNCDVNIHCGKLMHEFVNTGFNTIQKYLDQCRAESDGELLGAQKRHLDMYRGLLFTLGDLDYKKGKRIDEVSENIKAAHIQQELCSDSLNPNAKKFSDAKRDLLRIRDELELELQDLKERQRVSTEQFESTERALVRANVDHKHPTEELEDWRLDTREKMVKYRAMSLGHTSTAPLESELSALRQTFNESRRLTTRNRTGLNDTQ